MRKRIVQIRGGFGQFRNQIVRFRAQIVRLRADIAPLRPISCKSEDLMQREHPHPEMTLPISLEIYQQLVSASVKTGFNQEIWEIGAAAIREWMTKNDPDSFAMPSLSGYQWKQVFLPNGTLLRTIFNGKNFHCRVEGDELVYEGKKISPSGFVNCVGGVRRNAWKATWVLFPNSSTWKSAHALRTRNGSRSATKP